MKFLKNCAAVVLLVVMMGVPQVLAHTGSPAFVTWSNGQTLRSADLNDAFAHLHNTFSAGIVDAHISSSAAIAHSKLALPTLVPKLMSTVATGCAAGTCTQVISAGVATIITHAATGQYLATYAGADVNYTVSVTGESGAAGTTRQCSAGERTSTTLSINCTDGAGTYADSGFHIVLWDN